MTKRMTRLLAASALMVSLAAVPAFAATTPTPATAVPAPAPAPTVAPSAPVEEKGDVDLHDLRITGEVKEAFAADKELKSLDIKVETVDGDVHLTGKVHTKDQEEKALSLAKKVDGVKSVKNGLTVEAATKE